MKKLFKLFFIIAILFTYKMNANAKELTLSYADFYYERSEEGGAYNSWQFPKYDVDGFTAYCIQFEKEQGIIYEEASFKDMGIDESKKDELLLIAHYGYDYPNHHTDKYRAATQALLWELTSDKKVTVRFTKERYGKGEEIDVSKEKEEIKYLVLHHYDLPDFNNKSITVNVNQDFVLESDLLKYYDYVSSDGLEMSKVDNRIVINNRELGTYNVKFRKKQEYDHNYYFLASSGYQNMVSAGKVDDIEINFQVTVVGAKIKLQKQDLSSGNDILKKGIKFKITNTDTNEEVCLDKSCILETDVNGTFTTYKYLGYGNYLITEVCENLEGYLCNLEGVNVSINENIIQDDLVEVNFPNNKAQGNILIHKVDENNKPLSDVEFTVEAKEDVIDVTSNNIVGYKKGEIVVTLKTNKQGGLNIYLLPGKYLVYESKAKEGYLIDNTKYEADVTYKDSYTNPKYEKTFINKRKLGSIIIHKVDESKKVLSDTEFTLEAKENITFNDELIHKKGDIIKKVKTDKEGKIEINDLPLGKYLLYESYAKSGYLLDNTKYEVDLLEDNSLTNPKYENTFVNSLIPPRKYGTIIIHKINEFNEPLSNIEFTIEAKEDILYNNKVLYKKGDIVKKLITDKEGNIKIKDIPLGKYLLYETMTQEGYLLDNNRYEVELIDNSLLYEHTFINYEEGVGTSDIPIVEESPIVNIEVPDTMSFNYLYYLFNLYAFLRLRRR